MKTLRRDPDLLAKPNTLLTECFPTYTLSVFFEKVFSVRIQFSDLIDDLDRTRCQKYLSGSVLALRRVPDIEGISILTLKTFFCL